MRGEIDFAMLEWMHQHKVIDSFIIRWVSSYNTRPSGIQICISSCLQCGDTSLACSVIKVLASGYSL